MLNRIERTNKKLLKNFIFACKDTTKTKHKNRLDFGSKDLRWCLQKFGRKEYETMYTNLKRTKLYTLEIHYVYSYLYVINFTINNA